MKSKKKKRKKLLRSQFSLLKMFSSFMHTDPFASSILWPHDFSSLSEQLPSLPERLESLITQHISFGVSKSVKQVSRILSEYYQGKMRNGWFYTLPAPECKSDWFLRGRLPFLQDGCFVLTERKPVLEKLSLSYGLQRGLSFSIDCTNLNT